MGHCNAATAACEINNNPADGQSSDSRGRLGRKEWGEKVDGSKEREVREKPKRYRESGG